MRGVCSLDRACPKCGAGLVCIWTERMTHAHCEDECGYGVTSRKVRVADHASAEDAYDAMAALGEGVEP